MNSGGVRGEIGAHLFHKAGLGEIAADDRHGAAVNLDHEEAAGAVGEGETEHEVGDKADVARRAALRKFYFQRKGVVRSLRLRWRGADDVLRVQNVHVATLVSGTLQRHVEIDDLKLVLNERPARLPVLAAESSSAKRM